MDKRIHKLTFYYPKLEKIQGCFNRAYIVGGFIRDRILGVRKDFTDIDIVTFDELEEVEKCVTKTLGKRPFSFERGKKVVCYVGEDYRFDITSVEGKSIEEDLLKRDFTINAIAVDVSELFLPFNDDALLIDPFGGLEDLQKGIIRPVTKGALREDPVRIVRGVRQKLQLGFSYHESFIRYSREEAFRLSEVPIERIKEELVKILRTGKFHEALRDLDFLGAFTRIFKELDGIEKIPPSGLHQYNLKEHTFLTVKYLETFCLPKKAEILRKYAERVGTEELFPCFTDLDCLKLVALYHDVAKPLTVEERNGRLTFYGHDKVGAEVTTNAFLRLGFGKKASRMGALIVRHHLRPFFLYKLYREGKLTERAIYRFFRDTGKYAFHTILLAVADWMATSYENLKSVKGFISFIYELLSFYEEKLENLRPFLSGKEIMEIKGLDGPNECVGRIKEKMLELQAVGVIKSREDAEKFVASFSC